MVLYTITYCVHLYIKYFQVEIENINTLFFYLDEAELPRLCKIKKNIDILLGEMVTLGRGLMGHRYIIFFLIQKLTYKASFNILKLDTKFSADFHFC